MTAPATLRCPSPKRGAARPPSHPITLCARRPGRLGTRATTALRIDRRASERCRRRPRRALTPRNAWAIALAVATKPSQRTTGLARAARGGEVFQAGAPRQPGCELAPRLRRHLLSVLHLPPASGRAGRATGPGLERGAVRLAQPAPGNREPTCGPEALQVLVDR
jgi:hypothetical protein